ncbi:MAG: succinate dehydrogenase cytochrome b subunit [Planctomycetota bacterium]|nr:MAG: succinate dehydrogenase cytochrome b subunit [Planctomycetota bacterium]
MQGSYLGRFLGSTIGLKILMAITGVVMFGYLIGHVTGNMLLFAGPQAINNYSKFLHDSKGLLWGTRIILLGAVVVHIWATLRFLKLRSDARPVAYEVKKPHGTTFAARTMYWSGPVIALFIVYHILHLTTGTVHPTYSKNVDPTTHTVDVYANLVEGFQRPLASGIYILAMLAIGFHLSHGIWSMLQTIGVNRPNWEPALRCLAVIAAVLICGGFIAVPAAVLLGIVK